MAIAAGVPDSLAHPASRAAPQAKNMDIRTRDDDMVSPPAKQPLCEVVLSIIACYVARREKDVTPGASFLPAV